MISTRLYRLKKNVGLNRTQRLKIFQCRTSPTVCLSLKKNKLIIVIFKKNIYTLRTKKKKINSALNITIKNICPRVPMIVGIALRRIQKTWF